jgi:trehalose 6-phosphate phosphatase
VLLDFDGTLVSLHSTPEGAALTAGMRHALERVVQHRRVRAAIVSGRRRDDLVRHVRLPRLQYWGLFGWERRRGRSLSGEVRARVAHASGVLAPRLATLPGIWIEDKEFGFAVHFRSATPTAIRRAHRQVQALVTRERAHLHLTEGAMVWNVMSCEVPDKGASVCEVLAGARAPALPIYVGDDATDETVFTTLREAITVRVGGPRQKTRAHYRLADPAEVQRFLRLLDQELSHGAH